jgi:hypothetical protein
MTTLAWMSEGGCRSEDPGLFFPRQRDRALAAAGRAGPGRLRRCPVLATCLRYAMDTRQHGIWGQELLA